MPSPALSMSPAEPLAGGRLVAVDGRALPLTRASLTGDAGGGLARVVLEQTFLNPHREPLEVTFTLPLPADAAVSGFAFRFGDERVVGEVDRKARARQRFEDAVLEGHTAALLEEERTSLFTQRVGNIPPGAEVVCEVHLDQPLQFLVEGAWEWRFPTVVASRYLGAAGRVPDARAVSVEVADAPPPVAMHLALSIRDALAEGARPESPAHALHTERLPGRCAVSLAGGGGARLDRDLVVRWRVAAAAPGLSLEVVERGGRSFGLVTLVPPAPEARARALPRDLVVLLDTSGSMGGEPLDQARRLTSALVDSLDDQDQLELIEFSVAPRRWKRRPVAATAAHRAEAQAWLLRLQASGGTEMKDGILEALAPLRADAQRQVVLITDGLIGFEREVVEAVSRRLPAGCRVHTVGIGSAVNRALTRPVARAGRGVELVLGLGEDVEPMARRLLARTVAPLITGLGLGGPGVRAVAPLRLPDVHAGAPALFAVELEPGTRTVTVQGTTARGPYSETAEARRDGSAAVSALFGREQIEDLELSLASGAQAAEVDASIERLGLEFQLSTRLTSWVAVSEHATVDPRRPTRREVMPQALPYGISAEGVGLRSGTARASGPAQATGPSRVFALSSSSPAPRRRPRRAPEPLEKLGLLADHAARSDDRAEEAPPTGSSPRRARKGEVAKDVLAAPPPPAAGVRVLEARVVRSAGGELLLEVALTGAPLDWAPGATVELELEGGLTVSATVVAARTTGPGAYAPGLVLRLCLALEPGWAVQAVLLPGAVPVRLEVR